MAGEAAYGAGDVYLVSGVDGYAPQARARALAQLLGELWADTTDTPRHAVMAAGTEHGNEVLAHLGAITGLPVAGFAGTLAPGGSVFGAAGPPALGLVRAKTGNLSNVAALAGVAYAGNGQLLGFAFMADRVPKNGLAQAGHLIDQLATELASCGCR